jgi:penicillin amidase
MPQAQRPTNTPTLMMNLRKPSHVAAPSKGCVPPKRVACDMNRLFGARAIVQVLLIVTVNGSLASSSLAQGVTATRATPRKPSTSPSSAAATSAGDVLKVPGLLAPVQLLRDSAGIVHIRAANEHDLFFAQGYSAARDRLFQLELWRRQATGTMAEALGPRWVERDRASRLLKYRGSMSTELAHYHPRGAAIINAFVAGVNAYVDRVGKDSTLLPPELKWLGITPGRWTAAVVISRHNALAANARDELPTARAVRAIGEEAVKKRRRFEPDPVRLALDSAVTHVLDATTDLAVLSAYDGFKNAPSFRAEEVATSARRSAITKPSVPADSLFGDDATDADGSNPFATAASATHLAAPRWESNNWVVAGSRTASGKPIVANDPHRTIAVPSLRYLVHLTAPGWDVIGGGEPAIPGVAIGHNRAGAWGLTIFGIDAEDLYVYDTGERDARSYQYKGASERMRQIVDTIVVKGAPPSIVTLRFTRHGPVLFEDSTRHVAVALRAAWLEPGSAPYLASLRIDQANTFAQFRDAVSYARMPALNWVWGDTSGTIGWQSAGIAPIRKTWDGLVPVPGDGRFEWSGFLPIADLPHVQSPKTGFFGSANALNVPAGYAHMDAVSRTWAEPYRLERLTEVLDTITHANVAMMARLQHDETPVAARALLAQLRTLPLTGSATKLLRDTLLAWNGILAADSRAAALYAAWEKRVLSNAATLVIPVKARGVMNTVPLSRVVEWMTHPDSLLGDNPADARDFLLTRSLTEAYGDLTRRLGPNMATWKYGDPKYHYVRIPHPLDGLVADSLVARLSPGPLPRGGYANTLNATGNSFNQTAGASLRVVIDLASWDAAIATNSPGQSGDPRSRHYMDLFPLWASGQYVPLPFSPAAVDKRTEERVTIRP